jgi:Group II intron, maturase-specific domain
LPDGSRVRRESHARFCERLAVQLRRPTHPFRPRKAIWHGSQYGVSFLPAASPKALKGIRQTIRRRAFHHRPDKTLDDLARMFNPAIQGWINYYSHFYRSALSWTMRRIDAFLIRWARNKFKRLRPRPKGARAWLARVSGRTQISSPIGAFSMSTAEHQEPYESRGSRTVLGARGGEIPLRDSPAPPVLIHQSELARQATRQLSGDRRADLGHYHQNRSHRALRTRHRPIAQRYCSIRHRDGCHQPQTCRVPRRMELHHLAKRSSSKSRVDLVTAPKSPA